MALRVGRPAQTRAPAATGLPEHFSDSCLILGPWGSGAFRQIVAARWQSANERGNPEIFEDAKEEWGAFLGRVRGGMVGLSSTARVESQIDPPLDDSDYDPFWRKAMDL